jgi:16S rRNA processing protein RimM
MSLVRVGRVGRPHGVHGEVAVDATDLSPLDLHAIKRFTWRGRDGATRPLTLHTARPANARMLLRFEEISTREQAAALTLGELWAEESALPDAGPGQVYEFQMIGLQVVESDGRTLGRLERVLHTGAHPIYVVQGTKELLIPATAEVVRRVDLAAGTVTVSLPEGLEDL